MRKLLVAATLLIGFVLAGLQHAQAQQPVWLCVDVPATAHQDSSTFNCQYVSSANPLPVTASVSVGGFAPNGNYGTPLSVSSSSSNVALPTGTVVAVYNIGSTAAYCKLGASNAVTATTSDDYVPGNSAVPYTVGSNTYLACITASSTTTINTSGGTGLLTGFGGGGGGGGSGGAVYGPTAAGSAAANPPVLMGGTVDGTSTGNVDNLKVSGGLAFVNAAQPTAANLNATVVGTGTFAVQATLQASATTAIGKVDPNTIATWGLFATTQNVTAPTNAWLGGCQFTTTPTTITSTNVSPVQCDNANNMLVNVKTSVLPTGAATSANQTNATQKTQVVDGSGNVIASTSNALNVQCANCSGSGVSTADAATFTAGTSLFAGTGGQFTSGGATACVTGHQCEAAITADRSLFVNLADLAGTALGAPSNYGTSPGAVAVQGVNAFVTNTNANGSATSANSSPVVIASDQAAVAVKGAATGSAVPSTGFYTSGDAQSSEPSAATTGNLTGAFYDLTGKQVTSPYANRENMVRGSATATNTSATTIIAASGSGVKTYITDIECGRSDAGTSAIIVTLNDSASTVLVLPNNGGGGGNSKTFNVPLVTAANTAFTFTSGTSTSTVYCSAQGFKGY
jgi:hypothetical protein